MLGGIPSEEPTVHTIRGPLSSSSSMAELARYPGMRFVPTANIWREVGEFSVDLAFGVFGVARGLVLCCSIICGKLWPVFWFMRLLGPEFVEVLVKTVDAISFGAVRPFHVRSKPGRISGKMSPALSGAHSFGRVRSPTERKQGKLGLLVLVSRCRLPLGGTW